MISVSAWIGAHSGGPVSTAGATATGEDCRRWFSDFAFLLHPPPHQSRPHCRCMIVFEGIGHPPLWPVSARLCGANGCGATLNSNKSRTIEAFDALSRCHRERALRPASRRRVHEELVRQYARLLGLDEEEMAAEAARAADLLWRIRRRRSRGRGWGSRHSRIARDLVHRVGDRGSSGWPSWLSRWRWRVS